MSYLQSHRPGDAHVAKDDHCSRGLSLPVVDGGDRVFNWDFNSIAAEKEAIRWQVHGPVLPNRRLHRIRVVLSSGGVQDSEHLGHWLALRFYSRPAGHFLRDQIEKADIPGDIRTDDSVADAVERHLGALFFNEEHFLHYFPLDGIAQRPE